MRALELVSGVQVCRPVAVWGSVRVGSKVVGSVEKRVERVCSWCWSKQGAKRRAARQRRRGRCRGTGVWGSCDPSAHSTSSRQVRCWAPVERVVRRTMWVPSVSVDAGRMFSVTAHWQNWVYPHGLRSLCRLRKQTVLDRFARWFRPPVPGKNRVTDGEQVSRNPWTPLLEGLPFLAGAVAAMFLLGRVFRS